ncbi:hypothetical protein [Marinomonas transparens]|uniref:Uncharacterized protein n=1 Tax=Marinomonas transparens TaxID=2795388 RepID=A0A934JT96_9GAMM|nr:hypothetical protein [Marinomonas transparens]MBJ7536637.1 hypothetical protein [Marinomonas transparens]
MSAQETADLIKSVNDMTATVAGKIGEIDEHLISSNYLVQYKIYKDESTGVQQVAEAVTPFFVSLKIDFIPKYPDSLIVVRASGNFRVIRTDGTQNVCGMDIQLYDGEQLLNPNIAFLYDGQSNNIHANPNMLHIDNRGGVAERHYKIALLQHTTGTSLSYYAALGQGTVSVEEYQNV